MFFFEVNSHRYVTSMIFFIFVTRGHCDISHIFLKKYGKTRYFSEYFDIYPIFTLYFFLRNIIIFGKNNEFHQDYTDIWQRNRI
jgi:hypothetical protein